MSYLNLPTNYDEDDEGMEQDNIANISQAALLGTSMLLGRGGGVGRATSQAAKKATKATKKKGIPNTKIPKKQLPKTPKTSPTSSLMSMDAPLFSSVPLKEYTSSTKTKGAAMRKAKAVMRKVEDVGEKIAKAASALKMKGKAGIQKAKRKAEAALTTAKVIQSELKRAGIPSRIKKTRKQIQAGMTTAKVIRAEKKAQNKATGKYPPTFASTYRAIKEGLGLDAPGTFQAELQKKLKKLPDSKKKTNKELAGGKQIRGFTGPGKSASIGEIPIRPSDIRRVPKSENIFMPGLSRQYNREKKKPKKPRYSTGK